MTSNTVSSGQALVALLEAYGVDTVFGMPGVHTLELYRGLAASGIRHILCRHEQGAGFMADGYARVSGRPGVCFVITGPGVTNAATPLGEAFADSVPLLMVSSVNAVPDLRKGRGRLHEITEQRSVTTPLTAFSATALEPEDLPDLMARAFTVFDTERPRPVHIEVPIDVLKKDVAAPWKPRLRASRPTVSERFVEAAADKLASAKAPVLIIGGGAVDAGEACVDIAEAIGGALVTTIAAMGSVPDGHALSLGCTLASESKQALLAAADVVLALGTELAETDSWTDRLPVDGELIRVDIDTHKVSQHEALALGAVGDAVSAARLLRDALRRQGVANPGQLMKQHVAAARRAHADARTALERRHLEVLDILREELPEDGFVFTDMTQVAYTGNSAFDARQPRAWFHPVGYGTLGYALPAAIGAKVAAPSRPACVLVGDAGFMFTVQELATAVELELPLTILLWNNDALGQIRDDMVARGIPQIGVLPRNPDFVALAAAFGCEGACPQSLHELRKCLRRSFSSEGPMLIEIRPSNIFGD